MSAGAARPPAPRVGRAGWSGVVWLVPLAAAVGAALYLADFLRERGETVVVSFADGSGLRPDTPVQHRGVAVGRVVGVALDRDRERALVTLRLQRGQEAFASEGAVYWAVRPGFSAGGFDGLSTLASGPYIAATPGTGAPQRRFAGLSGAAAAAQGLRLVLSAPRLRGLEPGAPVVYRGVRVGSVKGVRLSARADGAEAQVVIARRYAPLVRAGTRFWTLSGLDVNGGLLRGLEIKLDSLSDLVTGGIAFATPEKDMGAEAADGARFGLEEKPRPEWLEWAPRIPIGASPFGSDEQEPRLPTGRDLMEREATK